jgi:multidrug efflux pump subunit AcrB
MAALFLKPHTPGAKKNFFSRGFDYGFGKVTDGYRWTIDKLIGFWPLSLAGVRADDGRDVRRAQRVPTGFIPVEDNGFFVTNVQLPDAASLERTNAVVSDIAKTLPRPTACSSTPRCRASRFIAGNGSNVATIFATLTPWDDRLPRGRTSTIMGEVMGKLLGRSRRRRRSPSSCRRSRPGHVGGLRHAAAGPATSAARRLRTCRRDDGRAATRPTRACPRLLAVPRGRAQYFVDIDRDKVKRLGLPLARVFETLQGSMGAAYVNDFNLLGRTYQVNVQADAPYRDAIDDVLKLEVRSPKGGTVPMGSIAKVTQSFGPDRINRYSSDARPRCKAPARPASPPANAMSRSSDLQQRQAPRHQLSVVVGVEAGSR